MAHIFKHEQINQKAAQRFKNYGCAKFRLMIFYTTLQKKIQGAAQTTILSNFEAFKGFN